MPIGYLVSTALVASCTLLAVAPRRRPQVLATMSFRFGVIVNELPFFAFYWLLASTVLAASQGDLDSSGGRALLDRALAEGLGTAWRDGLDREFAARLRHRLPYGRIFFAPFVFRRRDVERVADISYGDRVPRICSTSTVIAPIHRSARRSYTCTADASAAAERVGKRVRCSTNSRAAVGCASARTTASARRHAFPIT